MFFLICYKPMWEEKLYNAFIHDSITEHQRLSTNTPSCIT